MKGRTVFVCLVGLIGCGQPEVPDDIADKLSEYRGCGDVVMIAENADDSLELVFDAPALLADAHQAGGTLTRTYELDAGAPELKLYMGADLSVACDDVGGDDVDRELAAVSGTATLTVDSAQPSAPGSGDVGYTGNASLLLEDVEFEDDAGTLPSLRIENIAVGWLPG